MPISALLFRVCFLSGDRIEPELINTRVVVTRSGFYPGIHYMLGSWYTPRELGKRAMIFWLAGSVGQMFSGFLQAAAYTNLSGVHGYAGCKPDFSLVVIKG